MYKLSCDDAFSSVNTQLSLFILCTAKSIHVAPLKMASPTRCIKRHADFFSLFFNERPAVIRPYRSDFFKIINKRTGPSIQ